MHGSNAESESERPTSQSEDSAERTTSSASEGSSATSGSAAGSSSVTKDSESSDGGKKRGKSKKSRKHKKKHGRSEGDSDAVAAKIAGSKRAYSELVSEVSVTKKRKHHKSSEKGHDSSKKKRPKIDEEPTQLVTPLSKISDDTTTMNAPLSSASLIMEDMSILSIGGDWRSNSVDPYEDLELTEDELEKDPFLPIQNCDIPGCDAPLFKLDQSVVKHPFFLDPSEMDDEKLDRSLEESRRRIDSSHPKGSPLTHDLIRNPLNGTLTAVDWSELGRSRCSVKSSDMTLDMCRTSQFKGGDSLSDEHLIQQLKSDWFEFTRDARYAIENDNNDNDDINKQNSDPIELRFPMRKHNNVHIFTDPRCLKHAVSDPIACQQFNERPDRLRALWFMVFRERYDITCHFHSHLLLKQPGLSELEGTIHKSRYLHELHSKCRKLNKEEHTAVLGDTYVCPDTFEAAAVSAGLVIEAVKYVIGELCEENEDDLANNNNNNNSNNQVNSSSLSMNIPESGAGSLPRYAVVLNRPPGHHCNGSKWFGYCMINNTAVAIEKCLSLDAKVAVIDVDIHHGDGTQSIFYNDAKVLTVSFHQFDEEFFPQTGERQEYGLSRRNQAYGRNVNIPLGHGCTDYDVLFALQNLVWPILEQFEPDITFLALGTDGVSGDKARPDTKFTPHLYGAVSKELRKYCERIVVTTEGGYTLKYLAKGMDFCIQGLLGKSHVFPDSLPLDWIMQSTQDTVNLTRSDLKNVWHFPDLIFNDHFDENTAERMNTPIEVLEARVMEEEMREINEEGLEDLEMDSGMVNTEDEGSLYIPPDGV